jgi:general secretion pathway protein F/type IV pilus assembly protein PilC
MLFKYKGYDASGLKISSKIEADNIEQAKGKLKQKKIMYTNVEEDAFAFLGKFTFQHKYKLSVITLSVISRDLSIYLQSGISLLHAIKLIHQRYKNDKNLSAFFESITYLLDEGKNLYTSFEMQKIIELPDFYLQSVKISENGGILKDVLLELSIYLKEQDKIKKQIKQAMIYPVFIITVAFSLVGFMLSFIVPKITSIFEHNDQALPGVTQFVITLGDFVNNYYHVVIISIILVISIYLYAINNSYKFKRMVDAFMLKVPFISSLIELGELSRFAYMNSILIKSGVSVVQSFSMGANILNNLVIKELFLDASKKVVEGETLSSILDNHQIYKIDRAFIQAIAIGEETSQLSLVLENLAELYTTSNKDKIAVFLTLLEPIFMLLVGGMIGFIVIAMLLPIFTMSIS